MLRVGNNWLASELLWGKSFDLKETDIKLRQKGISSTYFNQNFTHFSVGEINVLD